METILVGYNPVAVYYVNVVDVYITGSNHNSRDSISINVNTIYYLKEKEGELH